MAESYTGTEGTAALADGMSILDGTEDRRTGWLAINKTRDYIVAKIAAVIESVWPVAKGGTGATTAATARTNLDVFAKGETYNRTTIDSAFSSRDAAIAGKASQAGLDSVYLGALSTAVYDRNLAGTRRAAWIQSDGLLGYSASSERYKKNIEPFEITDEQIAALVVVSYQFRAPLAAGGRTEIGLIAERLVDAGLSWAVFFNEDGTPEGINYDMIGVALLPVVQRLLTRIAALEATR